ncbi:MAG: toprim domain-containing protein [Candidatus Methylomirabilis sp.]|nr:toprim domain-containing protein [Deltaproteobacteria bacterium]
MAKEAMGWVSFAQVKEKVPLVEVLERYGAKLRPEGSRGKLVGVCPIHGSGANPNQFHVDPSKGEGGAWYCFGDCGRGGNVLDFVAAMEKTDLRKAALILKNSWYPERFEGETSRKADRHAKRKAEGKPTPRAIETGDPWTTPEAKAGGEGRINPPLTFALKLDPAHPYLTQVRKVAQPVIDFFGLGYCSRGLMKGRVCIPIRVRDDELIGYAGRAVEEATEPRYLLPPGFVKTAVVFNYEWATAAAREGTYKREGRYCLNVVEGFFACFALCAAGYWNTVAIMGSSPSEEQAELLAKTGLPINVLLDNTPEGKKGSAKLVEMLAGRNPLRVPKYPEGVRQPDGIPPGDLAPILGALPKVREGCEKEPDTPITL